MSMETVFFMSRDFTRLSPKQQTPDGIWTRRQYLLDIYLVCFKHIRVMFRDILLENELSHMSDLVHSWITNISRMDDIFIQLANLSSSV